MTTVMNVECLGEVLQQAKKQVWDQAIPSGVPANLMIAIDSLRSEDATFWDKEATEVAKLLEANPGVAGIFAKTNETTLAFAIRQARIVAR